MFLNSKLEQMDLSVKESDVSVRAKLHNRVASYRAELHRLAKEFARAKCTVNIDLGTITLIYRTYNYYLVSY